MRCGGHDFYSAIAGTATDTRQRGIEVVGSVPLIKGEKFLASDNFGIGYHSPAIWGVRTVPLWELSMNSRICRTEVIT